MRTSKKIVLLLCVACFVATGSARAQVMSKWGHPVISFGWTPYDVTDQGMGNYPGTPGFIPGYGYYPGPGPGTYPWMDGPGTPFDRRKLRTSVPVPNGQGASAVEERPSTPGACLIIVKIPAEAELWFDDIKTSQPGSYRRFETPLLRGEGNYTVAARWQIKGVELNRVENVHVHPGQTFVVNFLTVDSWTGRRLESLPPPRKVPQQ